MTVAGIELVRHLRLELAAKIASDATPQGDVWIRLLRGAEDVAELASHLPDEDPELIREHVRCIVDELGRMGNAVFLLPNRRKVESELR